MTTVLLVDDHELIRQGLRRAFERNQDFDVIGESSTLNGGRALASALTPDVVITDVRLPDGTGFDLARALRADSDAVGIVVLTMYAGDETLLAALESGASTFLSKDAPSNDVVAAARQAALSPRTFTARDLAGALQRHGKSAKPSLSPREAEVLQLLADGAGVSAIARRLFVSESTAKTHVGKIYEKLGAANRAQAIMAGVRAGLLSSD